jgi:glycosyltransferase involved in cell wall biosynthesis
MSTQTLRILQVLRAPIGGLYRHVADLSAGLAARGHALGLVMDSSLEDAHTDARLEPLKKHLTLGVHRMPIARLFGLSDLTTPFALRRLLAEHDVDVVHGHGAKGGFHARLARLGRARPVAVYTPHGGALHFAPTSLPGRVFDSIERRLFSVTDGVAFESAYAQKHYFERIGKPGCPSPVIHNGLLDGEFKKVPTQKEAADFAFVGELRNLKGIMYLLDALANLETPDGRAATLAVAGDGALRSEIEARIAQADLAGRVQLLGVQPARRVFGLGHCVVVPSLAESLPYVVLEAVAAGKPVIATNVGGIGEIFGNTANALVPPGNVEALRHAMQSVLQDKKATTALAAQRRDCVKTHFSATRMVDGIEALYRQALKA